MFEAATQLGHPHLVPESKARKSAPALNSLSNAESALFVWSYHGRDSLTMLVYGGDLRMNVHGSPIKKLEI
jgi:hypothetical protein